MDYELLHTLLGFVEVFRPALTAPGFEKALVVFVGWVLSNRPHAVTAALVSTDVARRCHHEGFHRFFSRDTWSTDDLGKFLFARLLAWVPEGMPLHAALDDTLAPKKGPHVFGSGSHLDVVRSTKKFRVFAFGHVWVVLSIVVQLPFAKHPWSLPVLFRLYRNKKERLAEKQPYRTKTELARELVDTLATWAGERQVHLGADSAYCNDTLMRNLSSTVNLFGAMRPDAVMTAPPTECEQQRTGRRRVRGRLLPKPEKLARDQHSPWRRGSAFLYGKRCSVKLKMIDAQWYRACGSRLVRVVVVRVDAGSLGLRVFFCTDATKPAVEIQETYGERWAIEIYFRDLRQSLGFTDSSAWKKAAVERTALFVGYTYTTLVLWFAQYAWNTAAAAPPVRPWYPHKQCASFADVLHCPQRTLANLDDFDLASSLDNLREHPRPHGMPTPCLRRKRRDSDLPIRERKAA